MNNFFSVVVLTYNEEKNISDCLESIKDLGCEIFIVDSYSSDRTLDIASQYTENIFQHEFKNYSSQRNWAQDNLPINTDWVFHLDADERATPELINELRDLSPSFLNKTDGLMISRRLIFWNKWIRHGQQYPAYHLRIFKKNAGRCEDRLYDQHFYTRGNISILKSDLINIITPDLNDWLSKHIKWSGQEASEILSQHNLNNSHIITGNNKGNPIEKKRWLREQYYKLPLFFRPLIYFFYRYFLCLGFLDGKEGMVYHFLQGLLFRFLVDAKIYQIRNQL